MNPMPLFDPFGGSRQWLAIPLRVIVGFGFMQHGYAKLARGPENFVQILQALHIPAPHLAAWATILTELLGGAAILIGAFTAVAAIPMALVLLVAIFTVHLPNGFSSIKLLSVDAGGGHFGPPGYECDLLYLAAIAALVLAGPGIFSVDGLIIRRIGNTRMLAPVAAYQPARVRAARPGLAKDEIGHVVPNRYSRSFR
ncbi:MAG TPA: DoxX family protein [Rhizomicrobium sp.]|jgi:putative oxidoreductase|nr:DoxX family protein [Rhizomicrobium sp.]